MISLSIHIPSIIIGFILGYIGVSILLLVMMYDERYDSGFGNGWDCGHKYIEKIIQIVLGHDEWTKLLREYLDLEKEIHKGE